MVGAKHFSELISWQLADQLRVEVFKFTGRPGFVRDLKLHSQTEGRGQFDLQKHQRRIRVRSREFARFLRISQRSMNELQDAFRAAELKRYVTADDLSASRQLMRRLYKALSRFIAYLDTTPDPPEPKRPRKRRISD